jgi:hypothetical protein
MSVTISYMCTLAKNNKKLDRNGLNRMAISEVSRMQRSEGASVTFYEQFLPS